MKCPVYIAATGIISSLGFTTEENFGAALDHASGVESDGGLLAARIDRDRLAREAAEAGARDFHPLEQAMILAIKDVIGKSIVDIASPDCGLIFSTTKGNIELLAEGMHEDIYLWRMAERIAAYFDSANRPVVVSNACISGVSALIAASRLIREGTYKTVIIAGGDLVSQFVLDGFVSFRSVSVGGCRPYDRDRDGLVLGEAAAAIVLTRDIEKSCGIVVEGGAVTNDANHISGPSRTGDGLCYAIEQALGESGATPSDVDFVNAHGTATVYNDEMESKALKMAGLADAWVTGLKSYFGHTLGAAGVVEAAMCVEQLKRNTLLGTLNFSTLGVPEPLRVTAEHRQMEMKRCMKTASGFGGCNAAIVLARQEFSDGIVQRSAGGGVITSKCIIKAGQAVLDGETMCEVVCETVDETFCESREEFGEFIRRAFKSLDSPDMKFFKMDDLCKLGYVAAGLLLRGRDYLPSEVAVVLANRSASLDTDRRHQEIVNRREETGASPAVFVYTLPNVVLGEICIRHKIQGENTFFIGRDYDAASMERYARTVLARDGHKAVVFGWCELYDGKYEAEMSLIEKTPASGACRHTKECPTPRLQN